MSTNKQTKTPAAAPTQSNEKTPGLAKVDKQKVEQARTDRNQKVQSGETVRK